MDYKIKGLFESEEIQKTINDICEFVDLPATVFNTDGEKLYKSGAKKNLSELSKTNNKFNNSINRSSDFFVKILQVHTKAFLNESLPYLFQILVPIKYDGLLLAYILSDHFTFDHMENEFDSRFRKLLDETGHNNNEISKLRKSINTIPANNKLNILFLWTQSAKMISAQLSSKIKETESQIQLEESQTRYKSLFENINVAAALHEIILDENGNPVDFIFLDSNTCYEEFTGLRRKDIVGKRGLEVIPNLEQRWIDAYGKVALTGKATTIIDHSKYLNKYWEVKAYSPAKNQFAVAFTDITERITSEQKLKESEQLFRVIAENFPSSYLSIIESDYTVSFSAGEEFNKNNIDPSTYNGQKIEEIFGNKAPLVRKYYEKSFSGEIQQFELEILNRLQEYKCIPLIAEDHSISRLLVVVQDITERKEKEKQILEIKDFNESIVNNLTEGVVLEDADGIIQFSNPAMEKMLGYSSGELHGKHWHNLVPTDKHESIEIANNRRLKGTSDHYETDLIAKDGSIKNVIVGGVPNYHEGKYTGQLAAFTDITARKKAEEAQRKNEQIYRQIFDSNQAVKLLLNIEDGKIVQANKAAEHFYGYTVEQLTSMNIIDINSLTEDELKHNLRLAEEENRSYFNFKHKLASGEIRDVEVYTGPVDLDDGKYLYSIIHDITDRKQAESELNLRQFYLEKAQEIAQIGTWELDLESNELSWTDETYKIFGVAKGTYLTYDKFLSFVHPDDKDIVNLKWQKALNGQKFDVVHRILVDDQTKWVREKGYVEFDDKGIARHAIGVTHDITHQKNYERALSESEKKFRSITENLTDLIALTDDQGIITYASPACLGLFQVSQDEMVGKPFMAFLDESSVPKAVEKFQKTIRTNIPTKNLELLMKRSDGSTFYGELNGSIFEFENTNGTLVVIHDVTERIIHEKRIKREMKRNQQYLDIAGVIILALDGNGNISLVNRKGCEILGGSESEILGKNWFDNFLKNDNIKDIKNYFDLLMKGSVEPNNYHENEIICFNGETKHIAWYNSLIRDDDEKIIGTLSSGQDITENFKAAEALKHSEERFKALHNASFGGIAIHDKGVILECNQGLSEISGYEVEELIGFNGLLLIAEVSRQQVIENINSGYEKPYEVYGEKKNGEIYPLRLEARNIPYKGKDVRVVEFRDLSEQKLLEEQLRQAQKIESIGHLAGGIAHDFNNLLTPIIANCELAMLEMNPADNLYADLQVVHETAAKASELTRQLLAFSRKQVLRMQTVDLNKLVTNFRRILRRTIREDIDIKMHFDPLNGMASVDPSQIEQVLMNLFVNAQDAMPDGGTITLNTSPRVFDSDFLDSHPGIKSELNAEISVSDTGTGMSKEIMDKIFDPFFTTKEVGKGTGLGLSTSYGIIKQHNGEILVESIPDQGTTFKLYLPLTPANEELEIKENTDIKKYYGSESILIVEDQPQVRRVAARILEMYKYNVYIAAGGEEAIKLIDEEKLNCDLLLTDIIMPNINGRELYKQIKVKIPEIKVLFMSGYTKDVLSHHGIMDEDINFIQKPLSVEILSRKVKEILTGKKLD